MKGLRILIPLEENGVGLVEVTLPKPKPTLDPIEELPNMLINSKHIAELYKEILGEYKALS